MRWIIQVDREKAQTGLAWARALIEAFDTRALEWLRIDLGRGKYHGVYGRCWLPSRNRPTYRISCQVPGPFPCLLSTRRPPLYPREDGTFPKAPAGCRRTVHCVDRRSGRHWYRVIGTTTIRDINEAIVWIVGHEGFHFLHGTKQLKRRDNEIEADRYADEQLEAFREACRRKRRAAYTDILDLW